MTSAFEAFLDRATGVPFAPRGRDYGGWDCWGVPYCAYRDVLGIALPDYLDDYQRPQDADVVARTIASNMGDWRERPGQWQPMDVALLVISGLPFHVGLLVDARRMIHVHAGINTCVEDLTGLRWRHRIAGVYSYAG